MNNSPGMLERVLDWFHSPVGLTVIAGLAGGCLRWITLKERPIDGFATAVAGALTSAFVGPIVAQVFGVTPENLQVFVGICFLMGIGGISIGAIVISLFKDTDMLQAVKAAIVQFLTRTPPPGPPPPPTGNGGQT